VLSTVRLWTGIFVPANTPRGRITHGPERARGAGSIAKTGTEPMPMSATEFGKYFREDVLSPAKLGRQVGIKPGD